jgi:hypothetical protein
MFCALRNPWYELEGSPVAASADWAAAVAGTASAAEAAADFSNLRLVSSSSFLGAIGAFCLERRDVPRFSMTQPPPNQRFTCLGFICSDLPPR